MDGNYEGLWHKDGEPVKVIPGIQVLSYGVPIEAPPGDEWVAVLRSKLPKRDDKERLESYKRALEQIQIVEAEPLWRDDFTSVDAWKRANDLWEAWKQCIQIAHAALHPSNED